MNTSRPPGHSRPTLRFNAPGPRGRVRRAGGVLTALLALLLLVPAADLAAAPPAPPAIGAQPLSKDPDIGDFVWYDTNGNGIQDSGEAGLSGIIVNLYNGDGDLVGTKTTDPTGSYRFMDLRPGDYGLGFVAPAGYGFTRQNAGSDPSRDSDADPLGFTVLMTLVTNEQDFGWDAGLLILSSIGATIFYDDDRSGVQDGAEQGIPGVAVQLFTDGSGSCDLLVDMQLTDSSGAYLFAGLWPGHYCVAVSEDPADNPLLGPLERTAGANPYEVTLTDDEDYRAAGFGYAGWGALRGLSYYDWNRNGLHDAAEAGIAGTQVCLYADADRNGSRDSATPLACAATDAGGVYAFTGQLPGGYLLAQTDAAGLISSTPNEIAVLLALVQGTGLSDNNDFGDLLNVQMGGFVWVDVNGNGVQDPSETTGLTGMPLHIIGIDLAGNPVDCTAYSTLGRYVQADLTPGVYTVTVPAVFNGYKLTSPPALTATLTLTHTADLTLDFGYAYPTGIAVQTLAAVAGRNRVTLTWQTLFEDNNAGFSIWRAEVLDGAWTQIGPELVPSLGQAGGDYRFSDTAIALGRTYLYQLRAEPSGAIFGPLSVRTGSRIFLPQVVTR